MSDITKKFNRKRKLTVIDNDIVWLLLYMMDECMVCGQALDKKSTPMVRNVKAYDKHNDDILLLPSCNACGIKYQRNKRVLYQ